MHDLSRLSKQISYILRHAPWEYELELDDEGWVTVDQLLNALNSDPRSPGITRAVIARMISASEKQRHEMVGERIRALYGHSLPGKLRRQPGSPPSILYHGTSSESSKLIKAKGLLPMSTCPPTRKPPR